MQITDSHYHLDKRLTLPKAIDKLKFDVYENNISQTLVISMQDEPWSIEELALKLKKLSSVRFVRQINPHTVVNKDIKKIIDLGTVGIKLHPRIDEFNLNNKIIKKLVDHISTKELAIVICSFWDGSWNKYKLYPEQFADLADKFPEQTFIWAHAGGHKILDFMFMARRRKNIYLDSSFTQNYFYGGTVKADLEYSISSLSDRFIFGTDFMYNDYKLELAKILKYYNESTLVKKCLPDFFENNYKRLFAKYD